jgi:hypothetical protein
MVGVRRQADLGKLGRRFIVWAICTEKCQQDQEENAAGVLV